MKNTSIELPSGKNTLIESIKKIFLPILTLTLLFTITFFFNDTSDSILYTQQDASNGSLSQTFSNSSTSLGKDAKCNIFNGDWVPFPEGPYYTNETNCEIDDRQNCMKFGRPDRGFMKWRWKPYECEMPLFDAMQFLELVRNKTLAFVGDSVARNQFQSLVCLLASAAYPIDVSYVEDGRFRRWQYVDYNFTVEVLWAPVLVKADQVDPSGYSANSLIALHLDEPNEAWPNRIEHADIVIISAGQWFFRPFLFYEKGRLIGCVFCNDKNITDLGSYYGYRMAFRTAFKTLLGLKNFKGLTFLRTFSPSHFENGDWDKGGNCVRTRPFTKEEKRLDGFRLQMYLTQVEEFKAAEKEGCKRGLKFRLLDTTGAMILRPDGHPNHYGHWPHVNQSIADCVHWCMPGPVETLNEFLLEMLKRENEVSNDTMLQKNA